MGRKNQGKTLDEYMKDHDKNDIVYIGASSGYFFIGTADTYEKLIDKISDDYLKRYEKAFEYHKKKKESLIEAVNAFAKKPREKDFEVAERMISLGTSLKHEIKDLESARKHFRDYTDMRTRYIKETYQKQEEDGTAVIIDGYDQGAYWLREEWNKDNPEYKV